MLMALVTWLAVSPSTSRADNIVETAVKAGQFKTLVTAVKAAGLVKTLSGHQKLTVFAPTDKAFAKLPKEALQSLLKPENKTALTRILTYHVVAGEVSAKQAFGLSSAETVSGQRLDLKRTNGSLKIDGANLVITDIECDNGVIHVIDAVLMPENKTIPGVAQDAKNFKTLLAAVGKAGLVSALNSDGPFTVFAPTDQAFGKLPKGTIETLLKPENKTQLANILKYHVVPGRIFSDKALAAGQAKTLLGKKVEISIKSGAAQVNNAKLIATDIDAANGVIHVIDSVLLPPSLTSKEVRNLLEETVAKGARIYNDGGKKKCEELYRSVMNRIIDEAGESVPKATIEILRLSLKRTGSLEKHEDPCWVLRHGIDLAYYSLKLDSGNVSIRRN